MKYHPFIMLMAVAMLLSSCSTYEKFTIYGPADTRIYTPQGDELATIGSNGQIKVAVESDQYYAYLLSQAPGAQELIPFALDFSKDPRLGEQAALWTSGTVCGAGFIAMIAGIATLASDSEDPVGGAMAGVGGAATLAGLGVSCAAWERSKQTSHDWQFKYRKSQFVNSDLHFTPPAIEYGQDAMPTPVINEADNQIESQAASRKLSQKSTRTFKNYGKQIEGTYKGTGSLKKGAKTIETYSAITVILKRVDSDHVSVDVIEGDASYFGAKSTYTIAKSSNNTYKLTCDRISDATITVDAAKGLIYQHPRVNIDGEIYTLSINAQSP